MYVDAHYMRSNLLMDPQDVRNKLYRIILTSPEMCLGNSGFAALLKEPRWSRSILFMVVDEAHCIRQWGGEFRKQYTSLETLRSFVPRGVPVLAGSATMAPVTLKDVRSTLAIDADKSFHLNLGNDRRNIVPLVWPMDGAASNLGALDFVVRGRDQPLRTIIYFNDKRLTMRACNYLRKLLPPSQVHTVDVLHATRGPISKKEVMERFRSGGVLVLCATEVVGMVCIFYCDVRCPFHTQLQGTDIPDVDDVVQFMTPEALSVWIQRAGRAGRDGRLSRAILLVEPSVAKKVTPKSSKNQKSSKGVTKGSVLFGSH